MAAACFHSCRAVSKADPFAQISNSLAAKAPCQILSAWNAVDNDNGSTMLIADLALAPAFEKYMASGREVPAKECQRAIPSLLCPYRIVLRGRQTIWPDRILVRKCMQREIPIELE